MAEFRAFLRPASIATRLLVSFAAAVALIGGLLAMHVLSSASPGGHSVAGPAIIVEPEQHRAAPTHMEPGDPDDHESPSQPGPTHPMSMAACALGLLTAVLLLLPPALGVVSGALESPRRTASELLRATAPPRPPSLHVLSISRT